jgi:hypothetical protein
MGIVHPVSKANRPAAASLTARSLFLTGVERLLEDLDLQRLAAELALEFAHTLLEPTDICRGNHIVIGADGFLATFRRQQRAAY